MATKTKAKSQSKPLNPPPAAPLLGPQTAAEWIRATTDAMQGKKPTEAERREYRKLLACYPDRSKDYGDMAKHYLSFALDAFDSQPIVEESVKHRLAVMRQELAGDKATPLEYLLIDALLACYQDYWLFASTYKGRTNSTFTLHDMEKWERILASKEARFLRAIAELARVRRLLNLPAPQLNINLPGGQQVNIAGDVKA